MTHSERKEEFEKLTTRAKRNGLLRAVYPEEGIAILMVPKEPPAVSPSNPPAEAAPPPAASVSTPAESPSS